MQKMQYHSESLMIVCEIPLSFNVVKRAFEFEYRDMSNVIQRFPNDDEEYTTACVVVVVASLTDIMLLLGHGHGHLSSRGIGMSYGVDIVLSSTKSES